jgi:hypothetical protein
MNTGSVQHITVKERTLQVIQSRTKAEYYEKMSIVLKRGRRAQTKDNKSYRRQTKTFAS